MKFEYIERIRLMGARGMIFTETNTRYQAIVHNGEKERS